MKSTLRVTCLLTFALLFAPLGRAQTVISWANAGTAFATGANWTGGTAPASSLTTNIAGFGTASPTQQPVLASSRSVAGVSFGSGAGAFTLSGAGTLTLGASGVNNSSTTAAQTISLPLALGAAESFTNSGTLVISGTVNTAGFGLTLTGTGASGSISGVVSGAGALTKTSTGTWTLAGTNTYSGGTTLSAGTLAVQNAAALGTGALTVAGGTLSNTSGSALTITNDLVWNGDLTFTGDGAATSDLTLTPGSVSGTGNRTVTVSSSNTLTLNSNLWPDPNSGGLTKAGPGTLKLTGSNYAENFTINGGYLTFTSAAPFSNTVSIVTLGSYDPNNPNRGTLVIDTSEDGAANLVSFTADISGTGALIKTGSGTVVLDNLSGGTNTYSGGTTISGGTLVIPNDSALGASWGFENGDGIANVTLAGGALRAGVGATTANRSMFLNGDGGAIDVQVGDTLTWAGVIRPGLSANGTPTLTKTGAGTLSLTNAGNSDAFTITVNAGTLAGNTNGLLQDITNNATVKFDQSFDGTFGGLVSISGTGAVIKAGTGTVAFSSDNSYSGGTTLSGGTLAVSSNGRLGSASGPVTFSGGTLKATASFTAARATTLNSGGGTFEVASATTLTWNGVIAGAAGNSLTKTGAGTLLLGGTNTYSGATTVSAGTLALTGSATGSAFTVNSGATLSGTGSLGALTINSGATLSPGSSPGTINAGNTTFAGGGAFQFEINNATGSAGTNWDQLAITGSLTLAATSGSPFTIDVTSLTLANTAGLAANFDSAADYSFTFITTTGGVTGFSANKFALNTNNFTNPFTGSWTVALTNGGNDLSLNYAGASAIPEPSSYAVIFGALALGLSGWHRNRRLG